MPPFAVCSRQLHGSYHAAGGRRMRSLHSRVPAAARRACQTRRPGVQVGLCCFTQSNLEQQCNRSTSKWDYAHQAFSLPGQGGGGGGAYTLGRMLHRPEVVHRGGGSLLLPMPFGRSVLATSLLPQACASAAARREHLRVSRCRHCGDLHLTTPIWRRKHCRRGTLVLLCTRSAAAACPTPTAHLPRRAARATRRWERIRRTSGCSSRRCPWVSTLRCALTCRAQPGGIPDHA